MQKHVLLPSPHPRFSRSTYFPAEALVEPSGDHAAGVGLHGEHSPEAVAESPADQVAPAARLEVDDPPASHVVLLVKLAGAVQGLQPQEAKPHLQEGAGWSRPASQGLTHPKLISTANLLLPRL